MRTWSSMTPTLRATVLVALAQPGASDRNVAKKCGIHRDTVRRLRVENAAEIAAGQANLAAGTPAKMLSWLDKAEGVLGKCVDYLGECADIPLAQRTPQHIHAMMGGTKILVDAITQWSAFGVKFNDGRTAGRNEDSGSGGTGQEVDRVQTEQRDNVTVLFGRTAGE
jgi:hypothetical protein